MINLSVVYGQMSLWGATVITNLMSAIPWVGQDIVEFKNVTEYYSTIVYATSLLPTIGTVSVHALKKGTKV
jgi:quinol-cytochrome oxidoreductase complex cytochrome b subunit